MAGGQCAQLAEFFNLIQRDGFVTQKMVQGVKQHGPVPG